MNEYDAQALDSLAPAYMARLSLHSAPFADGAQGRFMYLDPDRAQRLSLIQHLTQYSELLLLVKGAAGSGKTCLLDYYTAQAEEQWRVCRIQADAMMDADRLLGAIAEGFGLDKHSGDARDLVYRYSADQHHAGRIPVLLIDDAHELPADAFEAIFLLADAETADGAGLLRMLLFCEPQIDALLDAPALQPFKARITHTLDMPLLDDEQTAAYLRQRLSAAGYHGPALFTDREVRRIHKHAQGLPGRVNEAAHQWLLQGGAGTGAGVRLPAFLAQVKRRHIMLGGAALIIVLAVWVLQDRINALFQSPATQRETLALPSVASANTDARPTPLGLEPATPPGATPGPAGGSASASTPATPPAPAVQTDTPPETQSPPQPDTQPGTARPTEAPPSAKATHAASPVPDAPSHPAGAETAAPAVPVATPHTQNAAQQAATPAETAAPAQKTAQKPAPHPGPRLSSISPDPVIGARTPQVLSVSGSGFRPGLSVTVGWDGHKKRLSSRQVQLDSNRQLRLTLTTGVQPSTWTVQVRDGAQRVSNTLQFTVRAPGKATRRKHTAPVSETASASAPQSPAAASTPFALPEGVQGAAWLRARDPAHYTLQLLSTHSEGNVARFISAHHLGGDVASFHVRRAGQPWYTVVRGDYPNRAAAQAAAAHLPTSLKGVKPWVRRFDGIQAQLGAPVRALSPSSTAVRAPARPAASTPTVDTHPVRTAAPALPADLPGQGAPARPPAKQAGGAQALAWIWDQDPRHYTLQLLGARSEASVRRFLRAHRLAGKAVYFKTRRKGGDWYSLVYGSYPDREQARKAAARLPASLREAGPWARSFASIHAELSPPR